MTSDAEKGDSGKPMLGIRPGRGHKKYVLVDETTCGIGIIRHDFLQRFANQKAYVFLYGIMGLVLSAAYSYFNGTLTTMEKRFQIPSRVTGIITVGNDISTLMVGALITYYAGKKHRPRWIALGLYTVVLFCILNALPHFLYGPGEDALQLTSEYGGSDIDQNATLDVLEKFNRQSLCQNRSGTSDISIPKDASIYPPLILFISQFISGIGGSLYFTLGVSYMDDNTRKADAPALISFSYTIRNLGPALGYSLSSLCLKYYIAPTLTPKITNSDPRWLGAWWVGWLLLAFVMFIVSSLLGLFPHTLPKAHYRKQVSQMSGKSKQEDDEPEMPASVKDLIATTKRLVHNKVLMCSNAATVAFFFGYIPFWIYMPKYLEIMYKVSASQASLFTGTIGLVFSAIGICVGGSVITKYKPKARTLAAWNMTVACICFLGILSYTQLGCPNTRDPTGFSINGTVSYTGECNANCSCDYVKYSPVCAYGESYISPCHAGCSNSITFANGSKLFTDCSCVNATTSDGKVLPPVATPGPCDADCRKYFYTFIAVLCFLKFTGASARTSNFLISVRCVSAKDKPASMGFGATVASLFGFIPSPIFFGYLMDTQCLVWGKTTSGTGNCWLYDADSLRFVLNVTSSFFIFIGFMFDGLVWYYSKDLPIFDEEDEVEGAATEKVNGKEMDVLPLSKTEVDKPEEQPVTAPPSRTITDSD